MLKRVGASWPLLSRWEVCPRALLAQGSEVLANARLCRSALSRLWRASSLTEDSGQDSMDGKGSN